MGRATFCCRSSFCSSDREANSEASATRNADQHSRLRSDSMLVAPGGWHVFVWSHPLHRRVRRWSEPKAGDLPAWRVATSSRLDISAFRDPACRDRVRRRQQSVRRRLSTASSMFFGASDRRAAPSPLNGLSWWEYDTFIGWVGFIVCRRRRHHAPRAPLAAARARSWAAEPAVVHRVGFLRHLSHFPVSTTAVLRRSVLTSRLVDRWRSRFACSSDVMQLNTWLQIHDGCRRGRRSLASPRSLHGDPA